MRSLERRVQRLERMRPRPEPLGDHWPPEMRGQVIDLTALMRAIEGKSRGLPSKPLEQPDEKHRQTPR
jgi:hypothetical protein